MKILLEVKNCDHILALFVSLINWMSNIKGFRIFLVGCNITTIVRKKILFNIVLLLNLVI